MCLELTEITELRYEVSDEISKTAAAVVKLKVTSNKKFTLKF